MEFGARYHTTNFKVLQQGKLPNVKKPLKERMALSLYKNVGFMWQLGVNVGQS
jgi:hypothetical protein